MNQLPPRRSARYVLYWMIATRRASHNFALERAIAWARALELPLVVLEALRVDYPWASARLHRFVLDGMRDNVRAFAAAPVCYHPYVEPEPGAGRGLVDRLAQDAAVVITDEFPCFFLPGMVAAVAARLPVLAESVDSNGLLPLAATDKAYPSAAHYRRHMQKHLRVHLQEWPSPRPFSRVRLQTLAALPADVRRRWPAAPVALLEGSASALRRLPIDHSVPVVATEGGSRAARRRLARFVAKRLSDYHTRHNHPDDAGTSRLSPYLHFGHLSAHEIFDAVMRRERWSARRLAPKATGAREGWWGVGPGAEAFLDQLVVWRELAYNTCARRPDDYDSYDSLPAWARQTLDDHTEDERPHRYTRHQFEAAATHDRLWNAAMNELRRDGWFHNYMRMLWGKKILEWSASPREALSTMIAIMDRWSLDGRDPNSYAGYFWTLGRYDRPWPERPIYGKVRSMSSKRTAAKVRAERYVRKYGG